MGFRYVFTSFYPISKSMLNDTLLILFNTIRFAFGSNRLQSERVSQSLLLGHPHLFTSMMIRFFVTAYSHAYSIDAWLRLWSTAC